MSRYPALCAAAFALLGATPASAQAPVPGASCYADYQRIGDRLRSGQTVPDAEIRWALQAESRGCGVGPAPAHAPDAPPPVVAAAPPRQYPSCPAAVSTVRALKASNDADKAFLSYENAAIATAARGDRTNLCSAERFRLADAAIAAKGAVVTEATAMQLCENPEHRKNADGIVANNIGFQKKMRDAIEPQRVNCLAYH